MLNKINCCTDERQTINTAGSFVIFHCFILVMMNSDLMLFVGTYGLPAMCRYLSNINRMNQLCYMYIYSLPTRRFKNQSNVLIQ
jgi:hypothetical protein